MVAKTCEPVDPRIRRTRKLLQDALDKLLERKEFGDISVQDVAEAATVNRATFYDHYADKFALLECMVGSKFHEFLATRQVEFDNTCPSGLRAIVLAVCDYLARVEGPGRRPLQPHMESAIIAVVRRVLLEGLRIHPPAGDVSPELIAATASWAIYGAAREWLQTAHRSPSNEIADTVALLVSPILGRMQDQPEA